MRQVVLDTDTLSFAMRGSHPEVTRMFRQYLRVFRRVTIASPTVAEIVEGYWRSQNFEGLRVFAVNVQGLDVLPVDRDAALIAGQIAGQLRLQGAPIGELDPFIAAVAIRHELPLVTNNTAHYQRIVALGFDLELENWLAA